MRATNRQNTNVSVVLRVMHQLGSPVDLSVAKEEEVRQPQVEIAQTGPVYGASIFELEDGRAGYVFYVNIVNRTSTPIYCAEIEFRMPWQDPAFDWLPDPRARPRNGPYVYSFPGKGAPEFPGDQVLNQCLLSESGVLQPRVPYEGWLLAIGGEMPKHLRHGEQVEATLVIVASDGTEYPEQILLFAERCEVKPKVRKRESSLYEGPAGSRIVPVVGESQRSDPGATASVMPLGRP